jgi:hypothetical protein
MWHVLLSDVTLFSTVLFSYLVNDIIWTYGCIARKPLHYFSIPRRFWQGVLNIGKASVNVKSVTIIPQRRLRWIPRIPNIGTRWRWLVSFTLRSFYIRGKSSWFSLDRRLGSYNRYGHDVEKRRPSSRESNSDWPALSQFHYKPLIRCDVDVSEMLEAESDPVNADWCYIQILTSRCCDLFLFPVLGVFSALYILLVSPPCAYFSQI